MSEQKDVLPAAEVMQRRLKEARLAAGFSQKQLGIEAGLDEFVASARVNRYEVGVHVPDYLMATRMAQVLQVPVALLYCDSDEVARLLLAFHRAGRPARRKAMKALTASIGE